MRISSGKTLCFVAACLLSILVMPVAADEDPSAVATLKLVKLKTNGFAWPQGAPDLVETSKGTFTVFAGDQDRDTGLCSIRSIKMKLKGRVLSSGSEILTDIEGGDEGAVFNAFWIGDFKSGYGLLFVFQMVGSDREQAKLTVAKFNANGKLTTPFKTLLTLKPPQNGYFYLVEMKAGISEKSIGIAMATEAAGDVEDRISQSCFLETNLQGEAIGKKRKIIVPKGGVLRSCSVSAPEWNGERWLIGLRVSKSQREDGSDGTVRSGAVVMVAAVKGSSGKLKPIKIFDLNSKLDYITAVHLLPRPDETDIMPDLPGKQDNSLCLMYQYEKMVPDEERTFDYHSYNYYLQKLSATGTKDGSPVVAILPPWARKTTYNPSNTYLTMEIVSAPINYGNDEVVMAVARSQNEYEGDTRRYEQEVDLVAINRESGATTLLARKNTRFSGAFSMPVIEWISGKISLIAHMWPRTPSGDSAPGEYFYSRY